MGKIRGDSRRAGPPAGKVPRLGHNAKQFIRGKNTNVPFEPVVQPPSMVQEMEVFPNPRVRILGQFPDRVSRAEINSRHVDAPLTLCCNKYRLSSPQNARQEETTSVQNTGRFGSIFCRHVDSIRVSGVAGCRLCCEYLRLPLQRDGQFFDFDRIRRFLHFSAEFVSENRRTADLDDMEFHDQDDVCLG